MSTKYAFSSIFSETLPSGKACTFDSPSPGNGGGGILQISKYLIASSEKGLPAYRSNSICHNSSKVAFSFKQFFSFFDK